MNWSDNNLLELKLDASDTQNEKVSNRNYYINEVNHMCQFCGGVYQRYLMCSHYSGSGPKVFCRACFILTHMSSGFTREFTIVFSRLSQREIVRRTVDYVIKNDLIPFPNEIDKRAKKIKISNMEFSNLVLYHKGVPKNLSHFKVFFSQDFDTRFIYMNNLIKKSMFAEDDMDEGIRSMPIYRFSEGEKRYLQNFFSPKSQNQELQKQRVSDEKEHNKNLKRERDILKIVRELGVELDEDIKMAHPPG